MSNATHTPGPWAELLREDGHIVIHSLDRKDGGVVASTSGNFLGRVEANARLIAAAPEMLEALIAMDEYTHAERKDGIGEKARDRVTREEIWQQVRAAIAKARGVAQDPSAYDEARAEAAEQISENNGGRE